MKKLTENSKKWLSDKLHRGPVVARSGLILTLVFPLALTGCQSSSPQRGDQAPDAETSGAPSYEEDIAPLLKQKCTSCHGFLIAEKGLRLNSLERIHKGGESGPAVVPGAPDNSPLYTALSLPASDVRHMPPLAAGPDLTMAQKKLIHDWIAAGAK